MSESQPARDDDQLSGAGSEQPPGMPRWVKASAIVAGVVLLVIVVVMLLTGGQHGPGRHLGDAAQGVPLALALDALRA